MYESVILFDGVCNFCNGAINFIIRQDKKNVFRFAPFQSEAGQKLLHEYSIPNENPDSFVLIDRGKVYRKSNASLQILKKLPWYWNVLQVFRIVPAFLRDKIYDLIARNRYKWFGRRDQCMVPNAEIRRKFLD